MSGFRQIQVMFAFGAVMLLPGIIFVLCGGEVLFRGAWDMSWDAICPPLSILAVIPIILISIRGHEFNKFRRKKYHRIIYFICTIAMAGCIIAPITSSGIIFSAVMFNMLIQLPLLVLVVVSVTEQLRTPWFGSVRK